MKQYTANKTPWDPTAWVGNFNFMCSSVKMQITAFSDTDPRKRAALTANAMILRARRHVD